MPYSVEFAAGTSFFYATERRHLYFVISDPLIDEDAVLCVNFTSYEPSRPAGVYNDPACIVEKGEHRFVDHPTCVAYGSAWVTTLNLLEYKLSVKQLWFDFPASNELLGKMRLSAGDSIYMEAGAWQILVDQDLAN